MNEQIHRDRIPNERRFEIYLILGQIYADLVYPNRSNGVVYTPASVGRQAVACFCPEKLSSADWLLDPACGCGALLLAALNEGAMPRVIGRDVDPHALELAELLVSTFAKDRQIDVDIDFDQRDLFGAGSQPPEGCGVVLVNPPYGTQLNQSAARRADSCRLSGREADLFSLSLGQVLDWLETGNVSQLVAIIPDVIRMQPEYRQLRRELEVGRWLHSVTTLDYGSFPGVTVQPCLLSLVPDVARPTIDGTPLNSTGPADCCRTGARSGQDLRSSLDDHSRQASPRNAGEPWRAGLKSDGLWRKCVQVGRPLGTLARCHEGVHTGNIRPKLFANSDAHPAARRMLKGADIRPFGFTFTGRYLNYDARIINRDQGDYASLRDPQIFEGPKLLSRQTSDRLIVCREPRRLVTDNTLHSIKLIQEDDCITLSWLLLVLNSTCTTALYRHLSGEWNRPLPQIKLRLLRQIPIPRPACSDTEVESLVTRAEHRAAKNKLGPDLMAEIDALIFDSFALDRSDRDLVQRVAGRTGPRRSQKLRRTD